MFTTYSGQADNANQLLYPEPVAGAGNTGSNFSSPLLGSSSDRSEDQEYAEASRTYLIKRKPVPLYTVRERSHDEYDFSPIRASQPLLTTSSKKCKIYWVTPFAALGLFLLGLGTSIGHHLFLASLNDAVVSNQVRTGRYSLVFAFVVKASLATAITIAYAQRIWHSLCRLPKGISINGIDALFTILESPMQFGVWDLWRSTPLAALMALVVWLMPLSALVSPTALTVGLFTQNLTDTCRVPSIDFDNQPEGSSTALALSTTDREGNLFSPSTIAQRLVGLTMRNGRQSSWPSPCGLNCSYEISFLAPSWRCSETTDIDNPDAVWRSVDWYPWSVSGSVEPTSYWWGGYGDGANVTAESVNSILEYGPVYSAGLNPNTSQFWVGVSGNMGTDDVSTTETVQEYLDLHVFYCDLMNSSYTLQVGFANGDQTNNVSNVSYINKIGSSPSAWESPFGDCNGEDDEDNPVRICDDRAQIDAISLSRIMIQVLQGVISRNVGGKALSVNSTVALVPTLVQQNTAVEDYGTSERAHPYTNIGPLLEELSHNISISLIAESSLQVVGTTTTTCSRSHTFIVWKYRPVPLVVAYACAVGATVFALVVGGHALISSGVSRDKSFSTIVRMTRDHDLDQLLLQSNDVNGLPLAGEVGRSRIKLGYSDTDGLEKDIDRISSNKRLSFRLA